MNEIMIENNTLIGLFKFNKIWEKSDFNQVQRIDYFQQFQVQFYSSLNPQTQNFQRVSTLHQVFFLLLSDYITSNLCNQHKPKKLEWLNEYSRAL